MSCLWYLAALLTVHITTNEVGAVECSEEASLNCSNTIQTCTDVICTWQCSSNGYCDNTIFICTNAVSDCSITCDDNATCNSVIISSAAWQTKVYCNAPYSCSNVVLHSGDTFISMIDDSNTNISPSQMTVSNVLSLTATSKIYCDSIYACNNVIFHCDVISLCALYSSDSLFSNTPNFAIRNSEMECLADANDCEFECETLDSCANVTCHYYDHKTQCQCSPKNGDGCTDDVYSAAMVNLSPTVAPTDAPLFTATVSPTDETTAAAAMSTTDDTLSPMEWQSSTMDVYMYSSTAMDNDDDDIRTETVSKKDFLYLIIIAAIVACCTLIIVIVYCRYRRLSQELTQKLNMAQHQSNVTMESLDVSRLLSPTQQNPNPYPHRDSGHLPYSPPQAIEPGSPFIPMVGGNVRSGSELTLINNNNNNAQQQSSLKMDEIQRDFMALGEGMQSSADRPLLPPDLDSTGVQPTQTDDSMSVNDGSHKLLSVSESNSMQSGNDNIGHKYHSTIIGEKDDYQSMKSLQMVGGENGQSNVSFPSHIAGQNSLTTVQSSVASPASVVHDQNTV